MSVTIPKILIPGAGVVAFVVYLSTLAPTITWHHSGVDSGDLATAVAVSGVPHPPGYPTYLLLGDLFKLLPFGDIAYRLNLLSATCAALTVVLVGTILHHTLAETVKQPSAPADTPQTQAILLSCAVSAALLLAFSPLFWSQAVIAEVYSLNTFFAALLLYCALRVQASNQSWFVPTTFGLFGLSLGNHLSICFFISILIGALKARWQRHLYFAVPVAFLFGLSVYGLIPLRAATSPPIDWGGGTTWPNFIWLVSGALYRQYLFSLPPTYLPVRLVETLRLFFEAFQWWGVPVGLIGWQYLARHKPALAYSSLTSFLLILAYAIGYNTTDSDVYLLPALLIFALWLGWGVGHLSLGGLRFLEERGYRVNHLGWTLLLFPLISLVLSFSEQDLRHDLGAFSYAQETLQQVEVGAVIIADNDPQTFALWYGRYGLQWRPDVAIINHNLLFYSWYRQTLRQYHPQLRLEDEQNQPLLELPGFVKYNLTLSPIYLASLRPPQLTNYRLEPAGPVQRVRPLSSD